jgi:hypothetical protein
MPAREPRLKAPRRGVRASIPGRSDEPGRQSPCLIHSSLNFAWRMVLPAGVPPSV